MKEQSETYGNPDLIPYEMSDGGIVYALNDSKPVGDGFYYNPKSRYMGLMHKPPCNGMQCGTCTLVGYCSFCSARGLMSGGSYKA